MHIQQAEAPVENHKLIKKLKNKHKKKKSHKVRTVKESSQTSDISCSVKRLPTAKKIKIDIVCDTGATKSIISEQMSRTLKASINTNNIPQLYTASNQLMPCTGTAKLFIKPKGGNSYACITAAVAKNLNGDNLLLSRNDQKLVNLLPENWPQVIPEHSKNKKKGNKKKVKIPNRNIKIFYSSNEFPEEESNDSNSDNKGNN